jgi:long-chain acyl-CoA synthetase
MTTVSSQPWLELYGALPATTWPEHDNALRMFEATLERSPDSPLMYYFDTPISARRVEEASSALAAALRDRGVQPGDRIAMYLQNVPQAMMVLLATWKVGAVVVPCNPMLRERELAKILVDSGSRVLVCLDDLYEQVAVRALPATAVELTITTSAHDFLDDDVVPELIAGVGAGPCVGTSRLANLLEQYKGQDVPRVELTSDDIALMVYTSGTTGAPKGATNTHGNVVFATTVYRQWLTLDERDTVLGLSPLFHVTGLIGHLTLSMLTGAPLILFYRFDAEQAFRLAERYRATFTVSAVTAFIALLNSDALGRYDLSSLVKVYTGGAPTPVATLDDWFARTGTPIHPMYGLTEATSPTHMTPFGMRPPVDPATGVVSVGVPVFNTDVRVIAENGTQATAGHDIGELHIAGPQIVPGYWQKSAETAEALVEGYLRTGDVGFMDEAGWFYLVDRAKDMIVASGFKVWPREVEEVLYQHPAVLEAAVVGVPDPYRGETVKAYVSLKAGAQASADEIKAFARERMAAYKYPRQVEITDEIPKNASGKVLRRVFQEQEAIGAASSDPRFEQLRAAVEARAVLELGVVGTALAGRQLRAGRAVGLYERLEAMLAQVRADGTYLDRTAFLDANQDYHQYLIDLADNQPLSDAFAQLGLHGLFENALQDSHATSEQVIIQHELLTDAVAAGNARGATKAILTWTEASQDRVRHALGVTDELAQRSSRELPPPASPEPQLDHAVHTRTPRMDRAALAQALDARAAIEIGVLRLVGPELSDKDRERLAARLLVRTPLLRGDDSAHVERYLQADDAYHRAFIEILGNDAVQRMYTGFDIPRLMRETIAAVLPEARAVLDDHTELIAALRSGDTDAACRAIADQNHEVHAILLGAGTSRPEKAASVTASEDAAPELQNQIGDNS